MNLFSDDDIKRQMSELEAPVLAPIQEAHKNVKNYPEGGAKFITINMTAIYFQMAVNLLKQNNIYILRQNDMYIVDYLFPRFDCFAEEYIRKHTTDDYISGLVIDHGILHVNVGNFGKDASKQWGVDGENELNSDDVKAYFDGEKLILTDRYDKTNPICVVIRRNKTSCYAEFNEIKNGKVIRNGIFKDRAISIDQLNFMSSVMTLAKRFAKLCNY